MPSMRSWLFCIGNPGSMKSTFPISGNVFRWQQAMKLPNDPATLPTVGRHPSGFMPMFMKAFTNSLAASFSSFTPAAAGYWLPMPLSSARFSASTPCLLTGSPGLPWSMRMNGMPVFCSRYCATSSVSPIVAWLRSATWLARVASATISSEKIFTSV